MKLGASPYLILTSSSLQLTSPRLTHSQVRLGEWNVRDQSEKLPHEDHDIRSKTVHEKYNPATFQNDIALIRLEKPAIYKQHIVPVCLPPPNVKYVGERATVVGWGRTAHGQSSTPSKLQEVEVKVISSGTCQDWFDSNNRREKIYKDAFLCAGGWSRKLTRVTRCFQALRREEGTRAKATPAVRWC